MNRYFLTFIILIVFAGCTKTDRYDQYLAETQLIEDDQRQFIYSIIRYAGRLAPKSSHATKFNEEFNADYWKIATELRLDWYYSNPADSFIYFGMSRIAPSMDMKRVSIGGKVRFSENVEFLTDVTKEDILYYEEIFRTWKMSDTELRKISGNLFDLMVKNEDLSPFYPENSDPDYIIEFPNTHTYFDVENRMWISTLENPAEKLRQSILSANN